MQNNQIIIHVGLPKAASSSMQQILASTSNFIWLGKSQNKDKRFGSDSLEHIIREYIPAVPYLNINIPKIRKVFQPYFELAEARNLQGLLMSDEVLSGIGLAYYGKPGASFFDIAKTFQRSFGQSLKIVIIIREQFSYLHSCYKQLLRAGTTMDFNHFLLHSFVNKESSILATLHYSSLLRFLEKHEIAFEIFLKL